LDLGFVLSLPRKERDMKSAAGALLLSVFLLTAAVAGQIYGTLWESGKPIRDGVLLEVACGGRIYQAKTDEYGAYRLLARETGRCTLTVHYAGTQTPPAIIDSYNEAVHYDFDLVKVGGRYQLSRR
jgi:hypothetical protein